MVWFLVKHGDNFTGRGLKWLIVVLNSHVSSVMKKLHEHGSESRRMQSVVGISILSAG